MRFKILMGLTVLLACVPMLSAQVSPSLSADDVKAFRQALADRDFYKASFEESERQRIATAASRDEWFKLYLSEKNRADNVQGGRVTELQAEVTKVRGALDIAKDQMADDQKKMGEQNARIISLESSRKWYAGIGFVTGAVAGYYFGRNQDRIIQAATGNPFVQRQPDFGMRFKF